VKKYNLNFHFYADDSQIYVTFNPEAPGSAPSSVEKLTNCIEDIKRWMTTNMLKLNPTKTEFIIIGRKIQTNSPNFSVPDLKFASNTIYPSTTVRNLGVHMDTALSLQKHITKVAQSARLQLYNISRLKPFLNKTTLATAIHAFVTSRLDYANSLLFGLPKSTLRPLILVQNSAARLLSGAKRRAHITPILHHLHWLPVQKRIEFKIIVITHKSIHGESPAYLQELISIHHPTRPLRSAEAITLQHPNIKLKTIGHRSFSSAAPTLWNALPADIRQCANLFSFRKKLKTHLFKQAYT